MILFAAGDCFEAFLLAPVLAALRQRQVAFRLAVCPCEGLELPYGPSVVSFSGAQPSAGFVEQVLAANPAVVAIAGRSKFALAVANAARHAGRRVVHLDGGVRTDGGPADAQRREADHAANEWLVDGETERRELRREGHAHHSVRPVGSLMAAAITHYASASPAIADSAACAHVALHHQKRSSAAAVLATLRAHLKTFSMRQVADPAHWLLSIELRPAVESTLIVTDSVGYQRFAHALGVPCVVMPGAALWACGVAAGRTTQAGVGDDELAAALARAERTTRLPANRGAGVADRIVDALLAPPIAAAPPLPSDTDASGRTLGDAEIALVTSVLRSGTLNSTRGTMVRTFERRFAQWLGSKHSIACASGSAAVHCAIAALRLEAGDEVITTPITDMGAITPILYEGGVPVFADVDPETLNVTAATLRAQITPRTRAVIVTHLFGLPCDMEPILRVAREHDLVVIEDAAQAFGATCGERKVGTFGEVAAFSLQQGKHITSGEGGIVATDDDDLARRLFLFVNKAWGYGDPAPDHYFPALNYRLTELQGAVLMAQLPKLDEIVERRRAVASRLRERLADVAGIALPGDPPHGKHSWWKFAFFVDARTIDGGGPALGKRMQASGVACSPRYIQKPAFECALFDDWRASPVTAMPLQNNPRRELPMPLFHRTDYPGAVRALERVVVLPINERYTDQHVDHVASVIRSAAVELAHA